MAVNHHPRLIVMAVEILSVAWVTPLTLSQLNHPAVDALVVSPEKCRPDQEAAEQQGVGAFKKRSVVGRERKRHARRGIDRVDTVPVAPPSLETKAERRPDPRCPSR